LRAIFEAPDISAARHILNLTLEVFSTKASRAMDILEDGFDDSVAVLSLPVRYRKRLRTTNGQERLNQEIRRRERVIRIFPNCESALRLMGALLMEQDEAWSTGKKYFEMDEYWEWKEQEQEQEQGQKHEQQCKMGRVAPIIAGV